MVAVVLARGGNETRRAEGAERNEESRDGAGVSMDACRGEGGWVGGDRSPRD